MIACRVNRVRFERSRVRQEGERRFRRLAQMLRRHFDLASEFGMRWDNLSSRRPNSLRKLSRSLSVDIRTD